MLVEARIRFRHRGCYSESLPPGVRVVHLSGDSERCLCAIQGPEGADLDSVIQAMADWIEHPPQVLERGHQSIVVRCHCPGIGLAQKLTTWGATVLWPVVHTEGLEWWHLVAESPEAMTTIVKRLETHGEVHVEKLGHPTADEVGVTLPLGELTRELSARQLAVLRHALGRGYYASPRRVTLAELAGEVALARSTYQEHLQKAEERIMERFGGVLAKHPALFAAASRRAGRPKKK